MRILLVDPGSELRQLAAALAGAGHTIRSVPDLQAAWVASAADEIEVLVCSPRLLEGERTDPARDAAPGLASSALRAQMRRFEARIILRALEDADGDRRLAAHRLGIGLSSLYRKIEELDIRERARTAD
jgi:two-component system response regulator AtoC